MVVCFKNNILFALLVVLFLLSSSTRFSIALTKGEIDSICTGSKNPSFCFKFLKSNPNTTKLDLPGLAKFLIHYAQQDASKTQTKLQSLVECIADPRSKKSYSSCSKYFGNALEQFDAALQALEAKDPDSLNIRISAAIDYAETCKDVFEEFHIKLDPQILMKIDDFQDLCSVPLVISNLLPKK